MHSLMLFMGIAGSHGELFGLFLLDGYLFRLPELHLRGGALLHQTRHQRGTLQGRPAAKGTHRFESDSKRYLDNSENL